MIFSALPILAVLRLARLVSAILLPATVTLIVCASLTMTVLPMNSVVLWDGKKMLALPATALLRKANLAVDLSCPLIWKPVLLDWSVTIVLLLLMLPELAVVNAKLARTARMTTSTALRQEPARTLATVVPLLIA
jgi:hypothetical protein